MCKILAFSEAVLYSNGNCSAVKRKVHVYCMRRGRNTGAFGKSERQERVYIIRTGDRPYAAFEHPIQRILRKDPESGK